MDRIDIPRTKVGNLQRPSKEIILEWITRTFDELKPADYYELVQLVLDV